MSKPITSNENIMGTEKISKLVITTGIPVALALWRKSFNEAAFEQPEP